MVSKFIIRYKILSQVNSFASQSLQHLKDNHINISLVIPLRSALIHPLSKNFVSFFKFILISTAFLISGDMDSGLVEDCSVLKLRFHLDFIGFCP